MLWPGVVDVAGRIGVARPAWAAWGGALVMFGLFARAFHYGANTFAFALVDSAGLENATRAVAAYYTYPEWVVSSLTLSIVLGWIVLAVGGYLSRTLRPAPAIGLALMSGLMVGVLKGSTWTSVVECLGLAFAFVPLGVGRLRRVSWRRWPLAVLPLAFLTASIVLGRLG